MIRSGLHHRGACLNLEQKDTINSCANRQVHRIKKAFRAGDLARWTILVNAGKKQADNGVEDETIPGWMLPVSKYGCFGHRAFPDKVDLVLVKGWDSSSPPPSSPAEKAVIELVLVESTSDTHDHYLTDAKNLKQTKYVQLVLALQAEGWNVVLRTDTVKPDEWASWYLKHSFAVDDLSKGRYADMGPEEGEVEFAGFSPLHTVIVGHCGTHTKSNISAFLALGIRGENLVSLLSDLYVLAASNLSTCRSSFSRISKAVARGIG